MMGQNSYSISPEQFRELVMKYAAEKGLNCTTEQNAEGWQVTVELDGLGSIRYRRKLSAWVLDGMTGAVVPLRAHAEAILKEAS